ncbi:MAG: DNA polymerase IV [Chloroflexi bacterium]|nr:DNA polymerase IV [Chloroflexota bacterium]
MTARASADSKRGRENPLDSAPRQIFHLDLDAFFASVEVLLNPELAGKPLIVSMGNPEGRGVVSTASYEARKFGVHSAMPLFQAARLCPQAIIVPVRHRVYSDYSRRVMAILREASPLMEQVSIDEAYVEIPADRDAAAVAAEVQARIKRELQLDCTIGVASNKLVAKIACNTVKPRGLVSVPRGAEQTFLAPLAIDRLPGAGKATRVKLQRWNVKTIGDLARVPIEELRSAFGRTGAYLHAAALGQDDSPIVTEWKPKSVSEENTFERDTRDAAQVEKLIEEMGEGVARQLAREGYRARTIVLKLRYGDFTTVTRQTTLAAPTDDAAEICTTANRLLRDHWEQRRALRLVGVGAHNLVEASSAQQLQLELGL